MNKLILEEIQRMNLLSKYDNSKTLSEQTIPGGISQQAYDKIMSISATNRKNLQGGYLFPAQQSEINKEFGTDTYTKFYRNGGEALLKSGAAQKTTATTDPWAKYPCVTGNKGATKSTMSDGGIAYNINGVFYYANGRKMLADKTMGNFTCNDPEFKSGGAGKYNDKASEVKFDKAITVHSGHSEREAWEGYNVIVVILDEISGFAIDNTTGHEQAKTGAAIYDMYRASVDSRFPDFGKVILLSFPRYKNDYIQQRYDAVVAQKETIVRDHKFKMDEDLPDNTQGNEFSVEWEEDHILSYKIPKVYALKRPTWEINPVRKIDDFKVAFFTNPLDALSRFACMPPDAVDAFFKSREKVEKAFNKAHLAVDNFGRLEEWFIPDPDKEYFIHVDLAQKHDHCAVAMGHVNKWVNVKVTDSYSQPAPVVEIDAVRFWTPTKDKSVDFTEVKEL